MVPVNVSQNTIHVTNSQSLLKCVSYQASLFVPFQRQHMLLRALSAQDLGGSSGYQRVIQERIVEAATFLGLYTHFMKMIPTTIIAMAISIQMK